MNPLYRAVSLAAIFWTTVSMSAYTPHETGSRVTASGAKAKEGYTCAANFVPIGSVIIYDGHKYCVQDRMHPSRSRHVDIFMESHKKALQFGRKEARVQVITPDDDHLKLPGKQETVKKQPVKTENPEKTKTTSRKSAPDNTGNSAPVTHAPAAPKVIKPDSRPGNSQK